MKLLVFTWSLPVTDSGLGGDDPGLVLDLGPEPGGLGLDFRFTCDDWEIALIYALTCSRYFWFLYLINDFK